MKRVYAFAIGLFMLVAPMATATGLATADPATRPMDYQQVTDTVVDAWPVAARRAVLLGRRRHHRPHSRHRHRASTPSDSTPRA